MQHNENLPSLKSWLLEQTDDGKKSDDKISIVVETPWSTVIKRQSKQRCYFLKQTPPGLFIEPDVINFIHKHIDNAPIPKVISIHSKLCSFIMQSCGEYSLRTKFKGLLDEALLSKGLINYIKIQRAIEHAWEEGITSGLPDWRIEHIPRRYGELLLQKEMLQEEGLSPDEISQLFSLLPEIESQCNLISKQGIRATLVNCDFNENNMIFNEGTKDISIVDWGESVISHPFFSLAGHLNNMARRYNLSLEGKELTTIKQAALSHWSDVMSLDEASELYDNIQKLLPIYYALAIFRLQAATDNKSKKMQNYFVSSCLRELLKY